MLGDGALPEFRGKVAQNRAHLAQRLFCQEKIPIGPGQSVGDLHNLVINCQDAVLDRVAASGLAQKIGEDTEIVLEPLVEAVKRRCSRRSLESRFNLREAQANGGGHLQGKFRAAPLCKDQQTGVPEPVNEQDRRRDYD